MTISLTILRSYNVLVAIQVIVPSFWMVRAKLFLRGGWMERGRLYISSFLLELQTFAPEFNLTVEICWDTKGYQGPALFFGSVIS